MRENDEIIRHREEDKYYVETDKHQENIEDNEPTQYQENIAKNDIIDNEERQIIYEIQ